MPGAENIMFSGEWLVNEWRQLKRIDWQGLEFSEAGSWPVLLKLLSCALALALAFAAVGWLVVKDHRAALDEARAEEEQLLDEFREKAVKAAYLPRVRQKLALLGEQMQEVREMLPTTVEIPTLLDSINDAAVEHRLQIDHIRSQPTVDRAFYVEHPFSIQVQGGYHQIAGFVAEMAALPRVVTQHDFVLQPLEGAQESGLLSLSMQARTYSYQAPAAEEEAIKADKEAPDA
ncbi:type 4a pilus biogenesis protein PilO [Halomonas piscis]|uniref:Type 4a pilus biogenesis protein PilO n=1 Tax=Halomonas piscis TaxID=3031727 RepID=A0ABY9YYW3_9GAMM|nr:type 4a pilus biogenesis protein PilO [Halomonas piscis]WNK19525.1 type 4a pilus biogenesis protein PilO [Halomonas piscis]